MDRVYVMEHRKDIGEDNWDCTVWEVLTTRDKAIKCLKENAKDIEKDAWLVAIETMLDEQVLEGNRPTEMICCDRKGTISNSHQPCCSPYIIPKKEILKK